MTSNPPVRDSTKSEAGLSRSSTIPRLSNTTLADLPVLVRKPQYDRTKLETGIIHLGCGAFHRAHQALATQRAITAEGASGLRWGIGSTAISRRELVDALREQDNLYTVLAQDQTNVSAEVCGSISEVIHAPTDSRGLAERIADPKIKIVTLTVTVSGYCLDPYTNAINPEDPQVKADIAPHSRPSSPVGMIVRACELIRERGSAPPVFISCDNLSSNGKTLHRALVDFAALIDQGLAEWIHTTVKCPGTVSDRIAQPTTPDVIERTQSILQVLDSCPVPTEPYFDWQIEEFEGERPLWELGGAKFVPTVAMSELSKLRLLNGSHMFLAYLGALAGYETIAEAMNNSLIEAAVRQFMFTEQGATLSVSPTDFISYAVALIERFSNLSLKQTMVRIGRNGSDKMITRIVDAMVENSLAGRQTPLAILLLASWITSFDIVAHKNDMENPPEITIVDERGQILIDLAQKTGRDPLKLARAFLDPVEVFRQLPDYEGFVKLLAQTIEDIQRQPLEEVIFSRLLPQYRTQVS